MVTFKCPGYKSIAVKYLPATNYRGARMKASDGDGNSITVSYDCGASHDERPQAAARALCEKMQWTGVLIQGGGGHFKGNSAVFVFERNE